MLIHAFPAGAEFVGQVAPEQLKEDQRDAVLVVSRACRVIYDNKNKMLLFNIKGKGPESDGRAHLDRRGLAYVILDERGSLYENWQNATSAIAIARRKNLQ